MTIEFYFILTEPQMGENIGAAARVMANFGHVNLRLVNPRDGWPNPAAEYMATCGKFILDQTKIYADLTNAIEDLEFTFALCGKDIPLNKPTLDPLQAKEKTINELTKNNITKIGFVFGCERIGLTYQQISYCNSIITIPTHAECSSMNLAQAVAVMAYEFSSLQLPNNEITQNPASLKETNFMLKKLEEYLTITNFFQEPNKKSKMMVNINNMFNRNIYSEQEIRTLHGIFRSLYEYNNKN